MFFLEHFTNKSVNKIKKYFNYLNEVSLKMIIYKRRYPGRIITEHEYRIHTRKCTFPERNYWENVRFDCKSKKS